MATITRPPLRTILPKQPDQPPIVHQASTSYPRGTTPPTTQPPPMLVRRPPTPYPCLASPPPTQPQPRERTREETPVQLPTINQVQVITDYFLTLGIQLVHY